MKPLKHTILILSLLFLLSGSGFFTINTSASGTSQPPVYYVRFSGTGLGIYADPSLAGEPTALLPDGTYVQLLSGPVDSLATIRICGTGLEGYADMRYLKRLDAIVYDCDIYTYEEMQEDIAQLQARYPGLFHANITGQSADGRNLYELILGNSSAPKSILIHAGIHAPFTEPETLSLGAVTLLCRPSVIINYHSMGKWHTGTPGKACIQG